MAIKVIKHTYNSQRSKRVGFKLNPKESYVCFSMDMGRNWKGSQRKGKCSWALNNVGIWGTEPSHGQKSTYMSMYYILYSYNIVSYIKENAITEIRRESTFTVLYHSYWKWSVRQRTLAVQTCVIQGLTVICQSERSNTISNYFIITQSIKIHPGWNLFWKQPCKWVN